MSAPLIFCDLIEEKPTSLEDFTADRESYVSWQGTDHEAAYQKYREAFQPWRILIISGDNREPLFRSTERYFNESDAKHAIDIAFGPNSNVYRRQAEHGNVQLRLASG